MRISLSYEEETRDGYTYLEDVHEVSPGVPCPVSKTAMAISNILDGLHDPHFLFSRVSIIEKS